MDQDLKELFPEFLEEALDSIARVHEAFDKLLEGPKEPHVFEEILRGIHTVKGGCGMFGLSDAKELAHVMESELQSYRERLQDLQNDKIKELRTRTDQLEQLLRPEVDLAVEEKAHALEEKKQKIPVEIEETFANAPLEKPKAFAANPPPTFTTSGTPTSAPQTMSAGAEVKNSSEVLRVPMNLIGNALNGIWEVFLIRNQMSYLFDQQKENFKNNIDFLQNWEMLDSSLKKNISELENLVMAMRMSSIKNLFSRMEKVIDTYSSTNTEKLIHFVTEGKNTELDKKVIDMLGEPLIHLIRNAMDHGIETRQERLRKGKPEFGTIYLSAETNTDRVSIKIRDDGRGIDSQKLIEKAKQKNLDISDYENGSLNPINIIFLPGFSTAEKVTDVSGRGVGMDAVRHSLRQLGGNVGIETEIGKGSTFSITLPLSLSVITSTVFKINGQVYGANVNNIVEICRTDRAQIHSMNGHLHYEYRGKFISCYDLRNYISRKYPNSQSHKSLETHLSGSQEYKEIKTDSKEITLFVINYKQDLLGLIIDSAEQNMEVIVKPLPATAPKMNFVNGMSILPTGRAIFVLMLENLVDSIISKNNPRKELHAVG